jgi:hypothetical protein
MMQTTPATTKEEKDAESGPRETEIMDEVKSCGVAALFLIEIPMGKTQKDGIIYQNWEACVGLSQDSTIGPWKTSLRKYYQTHLKLTGYFNRPRTVLIEAMVAIGCAVPSRYKGGIECFIKFA